MSPQRKSTGPRRRKPKSFRFTKQHLTKGSLAALALVFAYFFFQPLLGRLALDLGLTLGEVWLPPVVAAPAEGTARVHFIDVGQASCTLIQGSEKTALIDAGEASTAPEVVQYLKQQGIQQIDYFFNTHPHADHMGGCRAIMEAIPTTAFLQPKLPKELVPTTVGYQKLLTYLKDNSKSTQSLQAEPGDTFALGGGLTLSVLGPLKGYGDLNNQSLVLRMDFGETHFLFTGDTEAAAQQDLWRAGMLHPVAVLGAPHHGSSTSIDPDFMAAILPENQPLVSVISVGAGNDYGHPSPETLELYDQLGITGYRTDHEGTVVITTDGQSLTVDTSKGD